MEMNMKGLKKISMSGGAEAKILPLVNRLGVVKAAEELGVAASTISLWLKRNGYVRVTRWEKA
jgi:hypothetical protein